MMRVQYAMLGTRSALAALVVLAVAASAHARSLDADLASNLIPGTESSRSWSPSWWGIAKCAASASPLDCLESRSQNAVDAMLVQMTEARTARDEAALEPEVIDKVTELSEVLVEAAAVVLERRLGLGRSLQDEDEGSNGLVEEGRGKKKKKIHKLIALVKLVLLVLVVKLKLAFLMMALQTMFQFKLVVMVFLLLLTKKVALWAQIKQAKTNDAQKVIYYEHAQHQHHYDDHAGWGGGGHDEHVESGGGGAGGWGGLWGRSYDTLQQQQTAASAATGSASSATNMGVQSGVYRAADGTRIVVRPPDAHDLAYSAQRP